MPIPRMRWIDITEEAFLDGDGFEQILAHHRECLLDDVSRETEREHFEDLVKDYGGK